MDDFDIFGHLLEFQKTEEFEKEKQIQLNKQRIKQRVNGYKYLKIYRKRYPHSNKMRLNALKYKNFLLKKQNKICFWCEQPLNDDIEIDHITPITKNGSNNIKNLCVCHSKCNKKKGNKEIILDTNKKYYQK